jgi:hypothetical protein
MAFYTGGRRGGGHDDDVPSDDEGAWSATGNGASRLRARATDVLTRERFAALKASYEARLRSLLAQVQAAAPLVRGDDIVRGLLCDPTSAEFVAARVSEVRP